MNNKQAKIFAAQIGSDIRELDLHGFYPGEALDKLELFLFQNRDDSIVRIIYGGGTGKLREEVLNRLKKHPLVEDIVDDGGNCLVLF
jgi:dsDNA-specific endonuclease/ATPase MutS2